MPTPPNVSRYRPCLSTQQLALLSAITQSPALKRAMITATTRYPSGSIVRAGDRLLRVGEMLGAGLVGIVVEATCIASSERFALKLPRGPFAFFAEVFRLEADVASLLEDELRDATPAKIIHASPRALLKSPCSKPTLQTRLATGSEVSGTHRHALEQLLEDAQRIWTNHAFIVDLSPKNLCWSDGRWIILDAGPKIHQTPFTSVLESASWDAYTAYFAAKTVAPESVPSVLRSPAVDDGLPPRAVAFSFVRDWWLWIPHDPHPDDQYFFVNIDDSTEENALVFQYRTADGRTTVDPHNKDLASSELVRLCARDAWVRQFPQLPIPDDLRGSTTQRVWALREPITLGDLATEVEPVGLGKAFRHLRKPKRTLETPTLPVSVYEHWTRILHSPEDHAPTDIYSHEPLEPPNAAQARSFLEKQHAFRADVPLSRPSLFCQLTCLPSRSKTAQRAILLVPGFRAPIAAMVPLARSLREAGIDDMIVLSRLGTTNPQGQHLVTGGRWETILLWDTIDYLIDFLRCSHVDIVAASYGTIAAMLVAQAHYGVKTLVLDSPVHRPLRILYEFQRSRGLEPGAVLPLLQRHHLPGDYCVELPTREGLQVFAYRPTRDRFLEVCGDPTYGKTIRYEAPHAALMRHDSSDRGLPACVGEIARILLAP